MKTALVLTGGGAKGAFEVGVLKEITKKVVPDVIVGTSVGAMNAALYLDGYDLDRNMQRLEEAWMNTKGIKMFPVNKRIFYKFNKVESLFRNSGIREMIRRNLRAERFDDLARPLYINCTKVSNGTNRFFYEGDLRQPLLATCAIMPFFAPVMVDREYYIDGGHSNYLGLEKAEHLRCDQVILVNLGYHKQTKEVKGLVSMTYYLSEMIRKQMITNAIKNCKVPNLINISPFMPKHIKINDLSHTEELIKMGQREAKKVVGKIRK